MISYINIDKKITKQKTVFIKCGKGNIEEYKEKGWKVVNKSQNEVACSWKTRKANDTCDIRQDKGCRITVPDILGEEIIYILKKLAIYYL